MSETPLQLQLEKINWQAPWWQPWRGVGEPICAAVQQGLPFLDALNSIAVPAHSMSFVAQDILENGMAYEEFIYQTQQIPTRENLHDFFNALVWLQMPQTKRRLNQLQHSVIAAEGVQGTRGALRDSLTLFDENAVICLHPQHEKLFDALKKHDWQTAFIQQSAAWETPPLLFGHALMEKLVSPYKSITGHVFIAQSAIENIAQLDHALSLQLSESTLVPKPYAPLPVLGVPNWWAENKKADFYTDSGVFRPAHT